MERDDKHPAASRAANSRKVHPDEIQRATLAQANISKDFLERLETLPVDISVRVARVLGIGHDRLPELPYLSPADLARNRSSRAQRGTASVRLFCGDMGISACNGEAVWVLHATDLDELDTVAWSAVARDSPDGDLVSDLMVAAVSRCRDRAGSACTVEWQSDNSLPFMSQEVVRTARHLDVTLVFNPTRPPLVGRVSDAFGLFVKRGLERRSALRDSEAILAELPRVIDGLGHTRAVETSLLPEAPFRPRNRKNGRMVRVAPPTPGHEG